MVLYDLLGRKESSSGDSTSDRSLMAGRIDGHISMIMVRYFLSWYANVFLFSSYILKVYLVLKFEVVDIIIVILRSLYIDIYEQV